MHAYVSAVEDLLKKSVSEIKAALFDKEGFWGSYNTRECAKCAPEEVPYLFLEAYIKTEDAKILTTMLEYLPPTPAAIKFLRQISLLLIDDLRVTKEMVQKFVDAVHAMPGRKFLQEFRSPISGESYPLKVPVYCDVVPTETMEKMLIFVVKGYDVLFE